MYGQMRQNYCILYETLPILRSTEDVSDVDRIGVIIQRLTSMSILSNNTKTLSYH